MKENIIKKIEENIMMNEMLISYLESTRKDLAKEAKAQLDLKIEALKKDIMFNKGFINHASKI